MKPKEPNAEDEEDDMVFVEEYFKLMAQILVHYREIGKSWKDIVDLYEKNYKS